jgi:hypothetical protein
MEPYIAAYTNEGMKFLALKLLPDQGAEDIQPLRFTLPGESPSIPIRLTGLAAEPEMSLLVFVLAAQRYEGANWESVEIDDSEIAWANDPYSFNLRTNWSSLVAKKIDSVGGHGWVTELAGTTDRYVSLLENRFFQTPEDEEAATELLGLFAAHPYLTRLYARVSAEEMTLDPVFRKSADGDVDNVHQLERFVDGEDLCEAVTYPEPPPFDPCAFTTCGAGGECFLTEAGADAGTPTAPTVVAGCACVPGATARTTLDASGGATVICQDLRMSFLNPGDRDEDGDVLPDTCAGFDCGQGRCQPMNLTPTCVCNVGAVAVGSFDEEGSRRTRCVAPADAVPSTFYSKRLPALPVDLPGGREVDSSMDPPGMENLPAPVDPSSKDGGAPIHGAASAQSSGGGCGPCAVTAPRNGAPASVWAGLCVLGAALALRRRRTCQGARARSARGRAFNASSRRRSLPGRP